MQATCKRGKEVYVVKRKFQMQEKSSLLWCDNSSLAVLQSLWLSRQVPPGQYDRNESDQVRVKHLASLFLLAAGYVYHVHNLPSSDCEIQKSLRKRVYTSGEQ